MVEREAGGERGTAFPVHLTFVVLARTKKIGYFDLNAVKSLSVVFVW